MKPLYVVQELSARCYAWCAGCFRTFVSGPVDDDMTMETFINAQKGIPPGTMILPQFHGESLLHPQFEKFLDIYKELGLRISMPASCGAGRTHIKKMTEKDTPIYILIMSVDGHSPHSQSVRRGNIDLEKAQHFVDSVLIAREGRAKPWIAVRFVEGGQSEKEFELYLKYWLFEVGVDFILRSRMFIYGSKFESPVALSSQKCRALVDGAPVVLFNGNVLLCERLPSRTEFILGNVNEDSWDTIMRRREEMTKGYPENAPCQFCSSAYLLTGFQGIVQLRHPTNEKEESPIYIHSDHSQTFYSLTKDWSGINWSLR